MVLLGYHTSRHFFSLYNSIFRPSNVVIVVEVQNDCSGLFSMCSLNDAAKPLAYDVMLCSFLFDRLLSSVLQAQHKKGCIFVLYCVTVFAIFLLYIKV